MDDTVRKREGRGAEQLKPAKMSPFGFRFSVRRMLLLVALASVCLAGFRVLSEAWSVWLATAAFYLAVVLLFMPRRGRSAPETQATE